jgi:hypothetical protein
MAKAPSEQHALVRTSDVLAILVDGDGFVARAALNSKPSLLAAIHARGGVFYPAAVLQDVRVRLGGDDEFDDDALTDAQVTAEIARARPLIRRAFTLHFG